MMAANTLPRLLRRNAASFGTHPAMREKRHGIWQTVSWSAYETLVLELARGLAARGFVAGDRLAVIGDNRPRLYAALLAAQSLGGVGVPLWPDADPGVIANMLGSARVRVAVAEDQEQISKLAAAKEQLSDLEWVVSLDPRAARDGHPDWLIDFATLQQQGSTAAPVDRCIADGRPDDIALVLYRNGQPGVLLSHANLLSAACTIAEIEDVRPTDETLCFLPMAWVGDMFVLSGPGPLGWFHLQLSGKSGDRLAGPARNRPAHPDRAARDLGVLAALGRGSRGARRQVEALGVQLGAPRRPFRATSP